MPAPRPLPRVIALPVLPVPWWQRGETWLRQQHGLTRSDLGAVGGGVLAGALLGGLGWLMVPARYTAQAALELNFFRNGLEVGAAQPLPSGLNEAAALRSELDVLTARPLARAVLAQTGQPQDVQAVTQLLSRLEVQQVPGSDTVLIRVREHNPVLAAAEVDALVTAYLTRQQAAQTLAGQAASAWLDTQLQVWQQRVAAAELAVVKFRAGHRLTAVASGLTLGDQQLSELNSQLMLARAQEAEAGAKVAAASVHGAGTSSAVLGSPLIQNLHEQESAARLALAAAAARYGAKHPQLIAARQELAAVEGKIAEETAKVHASLGTDVAMAHARATMLAAQLADLQAGAGKNSADAVQLAELERQAQASRVLYEGFLARSRELAQPGFYQPPARVIAPAEAPLQADGPSLGLVLALGAVIGGMLGWVLGQTRGQVES